MTHLNLHDLAIALVWLAAGSGSYLLGYWRGCTDTRAWFTRKR